MQINQFNAKQIKIDSYEFKTIVDVIKYRATNQANDSAYTFLDQRAREQRKISYAELNHYSSVVAQSIRKKINANARVIILLPTSFEFVFCFLGCMYANVIPVPINTPNSINQWPRFRAIIEDAEASLICTTSNLVEKVKNELNQTFNADTIEVVSCESLVRECETSKLSYMINENDIAFLQYTSGTTGTPKGVVITHRNLIKNEQMIQEIVTPKRDSIVLGWLPLYHDMGLIANLLQPLFSGYPCVLMPPIAFLRDPFQWLKCIERYKATITGAPNFAYEMCVNRIPEKKLKELNLENLEVAYCGSERIQSHTLDRFTEKFQQCGFHRNVFLPCYGLAEATLFVSGKKYNTNIIQRNISRRALTSQQLKIPDNTKDCVTIVGCGTISENSVYIVDPNTCSILANNSIGEIWVHGDHISSGYWHQKKLSITPFFATLKNKGDNFLRTGDLGFIDNTQLYVVGRLKEIIIIRGKNFYPEDIEHTARHCHPFLLQCNSAAFGIEINDEEKLILIHEIKKIDVSPKNLEDISISIRLSLANSLNIEIYDILFVPQRSLPVTSSGKIQRLTCKSKYINNKIEAFLQ